MPLYWTQLCSWLHIHILSLYFMLWQICSRTHIVHLARSSRKTLSFPIQVFSPVLMCFVYFLATCAKDTMPLEKSCFAAYTTPFVSVLILETGKAQCKGVQTALAPASCLSLHISCIFNCTHFCLSPA